LPKTLPNNILWQDARHCSSVFGSHHPVKINHDRSWLTMVINMVDHGETMVYHGDTVVYHSARYDYEKYHGAI